MDRRNTGVAVSGVGRRDLLRGVLGLPLAYAGGRSVLGASGDDPPNRFDRRPSGLIGPVTVGSVITHPAGQRASSAGGVSNP